MNTKTKKIFIVSLIIVTIVSIVFVVLMFSKQNEQAKQSGSENNGILFGALRPRRQQQPEPIPIGPNNQDVSIDQNDGDGIVDETINPGQSIIQSPNDYFTSIPLPQGSLTSGETSGDGTGTGGEVRIPTGGGTNGGGARNPACDNPALSSALRTQLCPDEIGTPNMNFELTRFVLNEEEQAELDRLTRNFARLAVYLRSAGDIEDLQSSQTTYNQIAIRYNRLAKDTEVEVNKDTYTGSRIRERSFLSERQNNGLGLRIVSYIPLVAIPYTKTTFEEILKQLGARDGKRVIDNLETIEDIIKVR